MIAHNNQIVEIRRTNPDGNESVKRRTAFEVCKSISPVGKPRNHILARTIRPQQGVLNRNWRPRGQDRGVKIPSIRKGPGPIRQHESPIRDHWKRIAENTLNTIDGNTRLAGLDKSRSFFTSTNRPPVIFNNERALQPLRPALVNRMGSDEGTLTGYMTNQIPKDPKHVCIEPNRQSGLFRGDVGTPQHGARIDQWDPLAEWAEAQVEESNQSLEGILAELTKSDVTENDSVAFIEGSDRQASTTRRSSSSEALGNLFSEMALSREAEESIANARRIRTEKEAAKRTEEEAARKVVEEAAAAKAAEEAAKMKFARRMPARKLIQPLTIEWEHRIQEALSKGDDATLTTTVTGTQIRRKDLLTVLGERSWLNDEIINGYLEWIIEHANVSSGRNGKTSTPKAVAFNSFFYKKLASEGPKSVLRWSKRKMIDGKRLLDVDTVLIPVNNASHWTLLVVSPAARTVEYLDSFGGPSKVFIDNAIRWLEAELGPKFLLDDWTVLETRSASQYNGYDCGVFCITNAECVVSNWRTDSYGAEDMAAQRRRIAAVLLGRGFVEGLGVEEK